MKYRLLAYKIGTLVIGPITGYPNLLLGVHFGRYLLAFTEIQVGVFREYVNYKIKIYKTAKTAFTLNK